MSNRVLRLRSDKSLRAVVKKAQADGKITFDECLISLRVLLLIGVLFSAAIFSSAYGENVCPEFIEVTSEFISEHPGWQLGGDTKPEKQKHWLESVGFSRGTPADASILHPDVILTDDRSGLKTSIYNFTQHVAEKEQRSIWLICEYTETREILTKAISVAACTVTNNEKNQDVVLVCE